MGAKSSTQMGEPELEESPLYLAIDIEKSHFSIMKGVFAVGFNLFDEDGKIYETFRSVWHPAEEDWDPSTDVFWRTKQKEVYDSLMELAVSPEQAKNDIITFLDKVKTYGKTIRLVSDNAGYDVPHFEVYFASIVGNDRASLNFYLNDDYWSVIMIDDKLNGIDERIMEQVKDSIHGIHDPLYDSLMITSAFVYPM